MKINRIENSTKFTNEKAESKKRCRLEILALGALNLCVSFRLLSVRDLLSDWRSVENGQAGPFGVSSSSLTGVLLKGIGTSSSERGEIDQWCNKTDIGFEWKELCMGSFIQHTEKLVNEGQDIHIVQIGAHVGFERNDPLAKELSSYLLHFDKDTRQKFHWTFVEPSPPNYKTLMDNIGNHSHICDMQGVNAAVIPDSQNYTTAMTFYSFNETIDPVTGYDSKSGITLPPYITQVSSLSRRPLEFNARQFSKRGLRLRDYIVETNVTTTGYTDLITGISNQPPVLVLIDTESFDCKIINGIDKNSPYLPKYLIYESKQCAGVSAAETEAYLTSLGYQVEKMNGSPNSVAIKKILYNLVKP